jgi:hypothetical protein
MKNAVFWDDTPCGSCRTDVSKELSVPIIRVTRIGELGTTLAASSNRHTLRRNTKPHNSRATRHNISEDGIHHRHRRENFKCYEHPDVHLGTYAEIVVRTSNKNQTDMLDEVSHEIPAASLTVDKLTRCILQKLIKGSGYINVDHLKLQAERTLHGPIRVGIHTARQYFGDIFHIEKVSADPSISFSAHTNHTQKQLHTMHHLTRFKQCRQNLKSG